MEKKGLCRDSNTYSKNKYFYRHPVTPKLRFSIRPVFFCGRGEANLDPWKTTLTMWFKKEKWPFDSPVGGHDSPLKGHLTIPKRSPAELPGTLQSQKSLPFLVSQNWHLPNRISLSGRAWRLHPMLRSASMLLRRWMPHTRLLDPRWMDLMTSGE